jgi:hypothetical protein
MKMYYILPKIQKFEVKERKKEMTARARGQLPDPNQP